MWLPISGLCLLRFIINQINNSTGTNGYTSYEVCCKTLMLEQEPLKP